MGFKIPSPTHFLLKWPIIIFTTEKKKKHVSEKCNKTLKHQNEGLFFAAFFTMAPHTAQFQNRHNQGGAHTHSSSTAFSEFRTATTHKGKLALKKRAPKLVTIITSSFHSI
jgi:hypothetical protein